MRMAELAQRTGVPVATLKFYLREGVLHPGVAVSRTQAEYDDDHVARVRLVRALLEVGGLRLARVNEVVAALDDPPPSRHELLGAAQRALTSGAEPAPGARDLARATAWLERSGWRVAAECDHLLNLLAIQLDALAAAGVEPDDAGLDAYATAMLHVAEVDVAAVPDDAAEAMRYVVVGTVLIDPLLATLRRIAQQHASAMAQDSMTDAQSASSRA